MKITDVNTFSTGIERQITKRYTDLSVQYLASHTIRLMANGSRHFIEEVRK